MVEERYVISYSIFHSKGHGSGGEEFVCLLYFILRAVERSLCVCYI